MIWWKQDIKHHSAELNKYRWFVQILILTPIIRFSTGLYGITSQRPVLLRTSSQTKSHWHSCRTLGTYYFSKSGTNYLKTIISLSEWKRSQADMFSLTLTVTYLDINLVSYINNKSNGRKCVKSALRQLWTIQSVVARSWEPASTSECCGNYMRHVA
jgi:hypothetical protein